MQISQTGKQVWRSLTAWPERAEQRSHLHLGACHPVEIWEELLRGLGKNNQKTTGVISQNQNPAALSVWESSAHMSSWRREAHGEMGTSTPACRDEGSGGNSWRLNVCPSAP